MKIRDEIARQDRLWDAKTDAQKRAILNKLTAQKKDNGDAEITIKCIAECSNCKGTGEDKQADDKKCNGCDGTGNVVTRKFENLRKDLFTTVVGKQERGDQREIYMCDLIANWILGDQKATEFDLKFVDAETFDLCRQYLEHHKGKKPADIEKPIRSTAMKLIVEDDWDADFINRIGECPSGADPQQPHGAPTAAGKAQIFKVILAANYLGIKSFLHLGCAKIAALIKGKSPEEIKRILGGDVDQRRRLAEAFGSF